STRIRTLAKTLVVIPNKTVAAAAVDNIARMPMRRVVQTVGLTYESSAEDMQKAVDAVNDIIHNHEKIDQEFTVAQFSDFGDSSLNIEIIYFTKTVDYNEYLAIKQEVNLAIMRAVEGLGLSIAFPTRTLYFQGDLAKSMAGLGAPKQSE
ncbi:MAG: mechanosensitive ion channel family protein, partial [Planctomycetota bacterium]